MSEPAPVVIFTHRKGLREHRGLLFALAGRDIRARYRQSFLGLYWAVLNPLLQTAVFTVVFSRVLDVRSEGLPFVVLYFSGVTYWNFFTTAVTGAMGSVVSQAHLLEKHRFPVEVLPLAAVLARLLDLAISGAVLVALAIWQGVPITPTTWLVVPMVVIATVATTGAGLLVAGLNVLYRDVGQLVQLVFTLGFFLTPVVYDVTFVGDRWRGWLLLNPVAAAIHGTRSAMFAGTIPGAAELLPGTAVAAGLLVVGIVAFRRLQATLTEVL